MSYRNPVLPGFHPDPSICRVGKDYYLCTSSFSQFPGAPIHHSTDLQHWQLLTNALHTNEGFDLTGHGNGGGMWAPSLRFIDGRFVMVTTNMPGRGHLMVQAEDPAGPWSGPILIGGPGYDPDIFQDRDGSTWFLYADFDARGITIQRIDLASGVLSGEPQVIFNGWEDRHCEGPHLYLIDDWYYLLCAEGGTGRGHMATMARSRSLLGPYEHGPFNPVLTQRHRPLHHVQSAGHADLFEDHDGNWWFVHLATRQFGAQHFLGRETFLTSVSWRDGWPVGSSVELAGDTPLPGGAVPTDELPVLRSDFASGELGPDWVHLHHPKSDLWSLSERPAHLRLHCDPTPLTERGATPLFIGRRQEHVNVRFQVRVADTALAECEEAGITIWQSHAHHYQLLLTRRDGRTLALWRRRVADMLSESWQPLPDGPLSLVLTTDHAAYRASIEVGGEVLEVGSGTPRLLSTELAGGFSGVLFALTACGAHGGTIDIAEVEYRVTAP